MPLPVPRVRVCAAEGCVDSAVAEALLDALTAVLELCGRVVVVVVVGGGVGVVAGGDVVVVVVVPPLRPGAALMNTTVTQLTPPLSVLMPTPT